MDERLLVCRASTTMVGSSGGLQLELDMGALVVSKRLECTQALTRRCESSLDSFELLHGIASHDSSSLAAPGAAPGSITA